MKVVVTYVFPMVNALKHQALARRFHHSLHAFDPGLPYELHVCTTGGVPTLADVACLPGLRADRWQATDNFGWDIGAFQWAAAHLECDLLVCLGAYVHAYKDGWLKRMADAYLEHGPGLYGCWGYRFPNWHIRTTAFWCAPQLLDSYPDIIGTSRSDRYGFEHGDKSFTRHVLDAGLPVSVVTWREIMDHPHWDKGGPGLGECLLMDQFTHKEREWDSR
jgi:hypothetical protein